MATATLHEAPKLRTRSDGYAAGHSALLWVLVLPSLFLAAQGHFSFELGEESVGGFAPGAVQTRVHSILGDIVVPAIAYSIVLLLMWRDLPRVVAFAKRFKMLTLMGILAASSTLWSQLPLRSLAYGSFYLLATLFAYWLVIRFEPREIMTLLVRTGVVVCVLSLLLIIFLPKYATAHDLRSLGAWRGIFSNRTGAAKVLVFLLTPALVSLKTPLRASKVLYVALLVLMLLKLHAVSSFVVLFVYVAAILFLRLSRRVGRRVSLLLFVSGTTFTFIVAAIGITYSREILIAIGRDPTLTGRTLIWTALLGSIFKQPILGYGFYSFWRGVAGESGRVIQATNWTFGYAHNGYLEVFLQVGVLGGVIFLLTLLKAVKDAWFCFRNDFSGKYDWYIGLIVLTIVYNIDECTVFWPNDLLSVIYIVTCCGLALAVKDVKRSRQRGAAIV